MTAETIFRVRKLRQASLILRAVFPANEGYAIVLRTGAYMLHLRVSRPGVAGALQVDYDVAWDTLENVVRSGAVLREAARAMRETAERIEGGTRT